MALGIDWEITVKITKDAIFRVREGVKKAIVARDTRKANSIVKITRLTDTSSSDEETHNVIPEIPPPISQVQHSGSDTDCQDEWTLEKVDTAIQLVLNNIKCILEDSMKKKPDILLEDVQLSSDTDSDI